MKQLFGKGREAFGNAEIDWVDDEIRAVLVDSGAYTVQIDVHSVLGDIPVGARVATSDALTGKTNVLGVMDADDLVFPQGYAMPAPTGEAVVFYKVATGRLIGYTDEATGLPITPNGAAFHMVVNDGANKLFKL